jgi:hypothetical protein
MRQEAAILSLRVGGQVEQVREEAPGAVSEVMLDAVGGDAYLGVRKAGVEGQWELGPDECRHEPGRERNRRGSALQVWLLLMWEGSRSLLMACWFLGSILG